ncbi:MAG: hypothetical protein IJC71_01770 [Clostridia bacterium]|nr:hypothetical protein [Clostridia bacterium]
MKFTKITAQSFARMQLGGGLLLSVFDPAAPAEPADEAIVCAVKDGITVRCRPRYADMADGCMNCPAGTAELKKLVGWQCTIRFTALDMTAETMRLALGAADADGTGITPRGVLCDGDFSGLWWVGDTADGGMAAVHIRNALSADGLTLRSSPAGRGELAVTLCAHLSVHEPEILPMTFYVSV